MNTTEDTNLAGLLKQLRDDTTTLVREEIALAKTELAEKVASVTKTAVMLVVGALLAYAALTPLLLGLGYLLRDLFVHFGLNEGISTFLGLLIVALIVGGISAAIILNALSAFKAERLAPRKTIQTLKEDKDWIQNKIP